MSNLQKDIVEQVLEYDCKRVIFTGGEPAMQDLQSIGTELKLHGIHLSIETNGTIPIPEIIDWICVSPKDQLYPNVSIKQTTGDELKVVYCGQDLSMYDELKIGFDHHYLQNFVSKIQYPYYIQRIRLSIKTKFFMQIFGIKYHFS